MKSLSLESFKAYLSPRDRSAHKGDFGHVLMIGGDYGMGGACRLAGEAALRAGAGLVSVATRSEHAFALLSGCPELMGHPVAEPADLDPLLERATVIAIGPGLGRKEWGKQLLTRVLNTTLPLIMDADALHLLPAYHLQRENWILTPHVGEAAMLLDQTRFQVQLDRVKAIHLLRERYQGVIVLKGEGTLVLGSEKEPMICHAGNPGMASAGMGDVLTGVIAALVAEKIPHRDAASLGVLVHALAGDAAAKKGERGMIARDLLDGIHSCLNP